MFKYVDQTFTNVWNQKVVEVDGSKDEEGAIVKLNESKFVKNTRKNEAEDDEQ